MTRQAVKESSSLTDSRGRHIPLAPLLSFWVINNKSKHDRWVILHSTMSRQLQILRAYRSVEIIVLWSGLETEEEMESHARPVEPVNFPDFLAGVGKFPLTDCS